MTTTGKAGRGLRLPWDGGFREALPVVLRTTVVPWRTLLTGALASSLLAADPADGQLPGPADDVPGVAAACGESDPELVAWCTEATLALQGARAGVGLALAGGSPLPGAAGTLGRRLGSVPRVSVAARGGLTSFRLPEVRSGVRTPSPGESYVVPGAGISAGVGLLDGFSLAPTVGGILSLDLLGSAHLVRLPGDRGFDGTATGWGLGARLGLLRESFTLPGVSVSVARYGTGSISLGDPEEGDPAGVTFDPAVTSIRATAGKDLLAVGVLAGVGWDRYGGDGRVVARIPATGTGAARQGTADAGDFTSSRTLWFGGLSLNFLVLQLSAEGGWATGFSGVDARGGGGFDPADGAPWAALSARLTF